MTFAVLGFIMNGFLEANTQNFRSYPIMYAGIKASEIAKKLGMSNSTVKRMLDKLDVVFISDFRIVFLGIMVNACVHDVVYK